MPVVPSMANRPKLWSLQPLTRPPVPPAPADSTNPIDAFVQALYTAKKVTPVGPADQRTLLRRVYMDLIGIPPTLAEQEAYLNDKSPDAYEKLIDRLLASEQYGVRYGRHWLDVLRYADAEERMYAAPGIHFWRDWVINAVNSRCTLRPVCSRATDGLSHDGTHDHGRRWPPLAFRAPSR